MITFTAEYTDTFAGEANYAWVRRAKFTMPDEASDLAVVRRAKRELDLTGVPCVRDGHPDCIVLRPRGSCTIVFITPDWV